MPLCLFYLNSVLYFRPFGSLPYLIEHEDDALAVNPGDVIEGVAGEGDHGDPLLTK